MNRADWHKPGSDVPHTRRRPRKGRGGRPRWPGGLRLGGVVQRLAAVGHEQVTVRMPLDQIAARGDRHHDAGPSVRCELSRHVLSEGLGGAYSAIQSAILAPELFRCAAGYAGIYDLTLLHRKGDIRRAVRGRAFLHQVLSNDADLLKKYSPVANAQKITVPVLIAHGGEDRRAPIAHAKALRDALQASKATFTWFEKPDEGHGFYSEANREEFYEKLLEFLAANTGTR